MSDYGYRSSIFLTKKDIEVIRDPPHVTITNQTNPNVLCSTIDQEYPVGEHNTNGYESKLELNDTNSGVVSTSEYSGVYQGIGSYTLESSNNTATITVRLRKVGQANPVSSKVFDFSQITSLQTRVKPFETTIDSNGELYVTVSSNKANVTVTMTHSMSLKMVHFN